MKRNQLRQITITAKSVDIVAGFPALNGLLLLVSD